MGLVSLTTKIVDEWRERIPSGEDEHGNPKFDDTWWVRVQATAVVANPKSPNGTTRVTAYNTTNDRDRFVKSPEHLIAVAETRAKKRALSDACNITEAMIHPDGKEATREAEGLPIVAPGDEDPDIPGDVRRKADISPPLSRPASHPSENPAPGKVQFQL